MAWRHLVGHVVRPGLAEQRVARAEASVAEGARGGTRRVVEVRGGDVRVSEQAHLLDAILGDDVAVHAGLVVGGPVERVRKNGTMAAKTTPAMTTVTNSSIKLKPR